VLMRLDGLFTISESHPLEQASPDIYSSFGGLDESESAERDRVPSGGEPNFETAVRVDGEEAAFE